MMHRVGLPDNPLSRTGKLFPNHYLLQFNGGLDAVKRSIPQLSLIELHFQLHEELPTSLAALRAYKSRCVNHGLAMVAHAPFLHDKNRAGRTYRPLDFDFVWPVAPAQYRKRPLMSIGTNNVFVREATMAQMKRVVDVVGALGIHVLTMHVGKSGVILGERDWSAFLRKLAVLRPHAEARRVALAVETGGLLNEHISDIIDAGASINFDTAHYFLDMLAKGKSVAKSNAMTVAAYKRHHESVPVLHLSQTLPHQDAHLGLLDKNGVLTCNEPVLRHAKKHASSPSIILETMPDKKAIAHVHKILNR